MEEEEELLQQSSESTVSCLRSIANLKWHERLQYEATRCLLKLDINTPKVLSLVVSLGCPEQSFIEITHGHTDIPTFSQVN